MDPSPPKDGFSAADLERLRGLARGLACGAEAEDLVHDAWLASHGAKHDDHPAWWRTVLRRRRAMRARTAGRRTAREARADPPTADALDPGLLAERTELFEALQTALAELDASDRDLVVRRYVEDMTASELSSAFDLPASTVRTKLSRSLARMREHLDRTYGGRAAWMTAAVAWKPSPVLSSQALLVSSTTTKAITAAALGSVVLAAVAWTSTRGASDDAPEIAAAKPAAPTSPRPASAPAPEMDDEPPQKRSGKHEAWLELRDDIRRARGGAAPPSEKSVIADEDPEALAAEILDDMKQTKALGPVFAELTETGIPLFVECLELLPESATGKLHLRASLIGEPEIGGIVESVEVLDDSLDQPEFAECLRESTYAIRLEHVDASLSRPLDITLDMEERSLDLGTNLDLEAFAKLHSESPELWAELLADPDSLENFAALADQPAIAEHYPELVASITEALGKE